MGGNNTLVEGCPSFISLSVIDLLLCDSSKSAAFSILRSELLTTVINNDVSGKVNARACASPLDKFAAMQMCFASGSAERKAVFEQLVDEKI